MSSHITKREIYKIVSLIDQWDDEKKFTWESLCLLSNNRFEINATRQTLYNHKQIQDAYKSKKEKLKIHGKSKVKVPPSLNIAAHRIAKLEAENLRLNNERDALLAQFVVWQFNAVLNNITIEDLCRPIPIHKQSVS